MNTLEHILVVIDENSQSQLALARAVTLAQVAGARITAMSCIYDFSYEMTTMLSSQERQAMRDAMVAQRTLWLQDLIDTQFNDYKPIELQVVWHNRPFEAIIDNVITSTFDLVIKSTKQQDTLKSLLFTPTDWHLIRKCPSPVLLVKNTDWMDNGKILAAVHTGSNAHHHQSLNNKIVNIANKLASMIKATVHLVNAYPSTPVNLSIEVPEFDADQYHSAIKTHHQKFVNVLATKHQINPKHLHIKEGLAEEVIPSVSQSINAELIVIGTIGRTGFSAAIIGNTAEHIINDINCDVLAIKPDGYVSPCQQS